jgi:hypothetical protein
MPIHSALHIDFLIFDSSRPARLPYFLTEAFQVSVSLSGNTLRTLAVFSTKTDVSKLKCLA